MHTVPRPDLRKFVEAIREQVDLACSEVEGAPREALQRVVVRAMECGLELQRGVLLEHEAVTPLLPPASEAPDPAQELPPDPKLPRGVSGS